WQANQFRLFLHSAAYWLLHQLRQAAPRLSPWRKATFETLRRAFLKIAVRVEELKSRIRIALPSAYPHRKALIATTAAIAAQDP
ncbi:MAG: transposase, partial [Alphaproteobacteria bacterium]|nr:transposase [Alphaproteobacteria bacterium]